jgi:flavin-binding protein dodecin
MSIAKVIEVISEGSSVEAAVENAVAEASKSVHSIRSVNVENIQARVKENKVTQYRLLCKVAFVIGDDD